MRQTARGVHERVIDTQAGTARSVPPDTSHQVDTPTVARDAT